MYGTNVVSEISAGSRLCATECICESSRALLTACVYKQSFRIRAETCSGNVAKGMCGSAAPGQVPSAYQPPIHLLL